MTTEATETTETTETPILKGDSLPDLSDKTGVDLRNYAKDLAVKCYINELYILQKKQEGYMRGECTYPYAEINWLKSSLLPYLLAVSDGKDPAISE